MSFRRFFQYYAPDDFSDAGVPWETLAYVQLTGTTLTVEISNDANGVVLADAIRVQQVQGDHGSDDDFRVQSGSPTIDAGSLADYYLVEPSPNGERINQGHTGNTAEAATSTSQLVQVLSPNGLEKFEVGQSVPVQWRSAGLTANRPVVLMNAGDGTVDNWLYNHYQTDGPTSGNSISEVVDISGLTNAAPQAIYQSYASANYNAGNHLTYALPVPDGTYTLRLHFVEPLYWMGASQRQFDILLQGSLMQANYDIRAAAGATLKAQAETYTVTASGGAGITVELLNTTYYPAVLSALEVTAANALGGASPTVDLELSVNSGGTYSSLATGRSMDRFGWGTYPWLPGAETPGHTALVRVTANDGSHPQDASNEPFLIANNGADYYLNDLATGGDAFTIAAGDNLNSGKSPNRPMLSLRGLLNAYDLDAGDRVHVDTGIYRVYRNVLLVPEDSGVRIEGPATTAAVLSRNNTNIARYVIEAAGGDDVTLDRLTLTGAATGIFADSRADSDHLSVSRNDIYGNSQSGVDVDSSNDTATIAGNKVHGMPTGIEVRAMQAMVSGNDVYENSTGIAAHYSGSVPADRTTVTGNMVYDNTNSGIYAQYNVMVTENEVSGSTVGIDAYNGAEVTRNNVFANDDGIHLYSSSVAAENRVYNNTDTGIHAQTDTDVRANAIYSNSIGVLADYYYSGDIVNNLIYANTNQGILIGHGYGGPRVINNTVYQPVGDAVRVQGNSPDVQLRNNILWVEAGYDLYVASDSQTGFDSQYNLFHCGSDPNAHVGFWGGTAADLLQDWHAVSGQDEFTADGNDANDLSRQGYPRFVDINGADNVLGYAAAQSYNGGPDDNFLIAAGSPAIDRADTWAALPYDLTGGPRVDDPDTVNAGSTGYLEGVVPGSVFGGAATGTAQGWRADDAFWSLTLPFSFPFYGVTYTNVYVSDNGLLQFVYGESPSEPANSVASLARRVGIAPLWDDLRTNGDGDDIFVDSSVAGQITIRWDATNKADGSDVNFAVTLLATGEFRIDYGPGNDQLSPTVGISRGDGYNVRLSAYHGRDDLTSVDSVRWALEEVGFVDIGAYEFRGTSGDVTPPHVTGTVPAVVEAGAGTQQPVTSLVLTFSEALNPIDAVARANYELRRAVNGTFGDGDDIVYPLTPQYTFDVLSGSSQTVLDFGLSGAALPPDTYRLTVLGREDAALHDLAGNRLDGDRNGTPGPNYVRTFTVTEAFMVSQFRPTSTGFVAEFNRSLNPSQLNLYDQGNQLGAADVLVTGSTGEPVRGSLVVDPGLRRVTFIKTGGLLEPDTYTVTLKSGVAAFRDLASELLDGDGNGTPGGDYVANFTVTAPAANAVTVSLPNFARGYGQPVNLPADNLTAGLPLTVSNGLGVSRVDLTLDYNPALLQITGFTLGSALVASNAQFSLTTTTPGRAVLSVWAAVSFGAVSAPLSVGSFTAHVPNNAAYAGKHLLDLADLHVYKDGPNLNEVPALDDDAIHVAAFFGDTSGDGWYNSPDATLTRRIIGQVNSGFSAFQLADPVLIADITLDNGIQSNDTTGIRRAIGQVAVPNIPALPTGLTFPTASGPDPRVFIPRDLAGVVGETLTVPVMIEVTEPAGLTIGGFDIVVEFDADKFTVSQAKLGALFQGSDLVGVMTQPAVGKLIFSAGSLVGTPHFRAGTVGTLVTLTVDVADDAAVGPVAFNLLASLGPSRTGLYAADLQELVLNPPPTNADDDLVDGVLTVDAGSTPMCTPLDVLVAVSDLNAWASPAAEGESGRWRHGAAPQPRTISIAWCATAAEASVETDLRDQVFHDLETELSPLEGVFGDLADDIASAWC